MAGVQRFSDPAADVVPGTAAVRHRVVVRVYSGDGRRHAYLAVDLVQEGYYQVHPVCNQVFGYRLAHLAELIGPTSFRNLENRFEGCESCANSTTRSPRRQRNRGGARHAGRSWERTTTSASRVESDCGPGRMIMPRPSA